jgi:hypothetical protein
MSAADQAGQPDVEERGRQSRGTSGSAIYAMVTEALAGRHPGGGLLLDVGCGSGSLWPYLRDRFDRYMGADSGAADSVKFAVESLKRGIVLFNPISTIRGRCHEGRGCQCCCQTSRWSRPPLKECSRIMQNQVHRTSS